MTQRHEEPPIVNPKKATPFSMTKILKTAKETVRLKWTEMNMIDCDPLLTGKLTAEYKALQNDLLQARNLATDYQSKLNDKSNDFAALKLTLDRTLADLEKLQGYILALREERHRLANEVMRNVALEAKVNMLTEELKREREMWAQKG